MDIPAAGAHQDPIGALERTDIGDDQTDICSRDPFDRRHFAEGPMVCPNARLRRHKKRLIAVVPRLGNAVHERRRNVILTGGIGAAARGALRVMFRLSYRLLAVSSGTITAAKGAP